MDLKDVTIDKNKQEEGIWVEYDAETSFKIARMGNPRFVKRLQELEAQHTRFRGKSSISREQQNTNALKVSSETILLDWKGLTWNGEPLEYSPEMSYKILTNDQLDPVRMFVLNVAAQEESYREDEIQETGKKSKSSTRGK